VGIRQALKEGHPQPPRARLSLSAPFLSLCKWCKSKQPFLATFVYKFSTKCCGEAGAVKKNSRMIPLLLLMLMSLRIHCVNLPASIESNTAKTITTETFAEYQSAFTN
jgi:hypothetical protein